MSGAVFQIDEVRGRARIEDAADVVIVGTGAAGGTAARVLTEAGLDVVMVEEGPLVRSEELRRDVYTGCRRVWREGGFQVAEGRAYIPVLQGRCVGGSTAINSAIVHRLPESIHAEWCRDQGAGEVLGYAALERAWDTLDRELSVSPASHDARGGNNLLMEEAARKLGWVSNITLRSVRECRGADRCLQGCPTEQKQSMNVSYVPRAIAAGARLYATCRVERVTASGGRADGVKARFIEPLSGRSGPSLHVRARRAVVLAASAIQTPLILSASGVGQRSGLVGRRLQTHPATAVIGLFDREVRLWHGATQGHESKQFWDRGMKLESIGLPLELAAVRLPGIGADLMRKLASFGHMAAWGLEMRAEAHGRVFRSALGRTVIRYDLTDRDVRVLKEGVRVLCEMMLSAGAREVYPGIHGIPDAITSMDGLAELPRLPDDPRILHSITSHMFGTAVMGKDPARSVVAPDLQCHELPGLYVVDSSVFPTTIGVNPQHAIAGIAWVACERLKDTG